MLLVAICVAGGVGAAFLYLEMVPRVFDACATLHYSALPKGVLRLEGVLPEQGRGAITEGRLQAFGLTLLDADLLREVLEENNLDDGSRLRVDGSGGGGLSSPTAVLRSRLRVDIDEQDQVIGLHVRLADPELAAQLANALADALAARSGQTREQIVRKAIKRLEGVMQQVRSETAGTPEDPKPATGGDFEGTQDLREVEAELLVLDRSRVETLVERVRLETEAGELRRVSTNTSDLLQIPSIADDPHIKTINERLVGREVEVMRLRRAGNSETNSELLRVNSELESLRGALVDAVSIATDRLEMDLAKVKAQEQDLEAKYTDLLARQRALRSEAGTEAAGPVLASADTRQRMWLRLQEGLQEIELAGQIFGTPLQIAERAVAIDLPATPDRPRTMLWGAASGTAFGLFLLLFLGRPQQVLKTVAELESEVDKPVLGGIPKVTDSRSADAAAESFRSLQGAFGLICKQEVPRSFLLTSSLAQEGKTFCSVSFAVSLAQQGFSTLLVDADLRRPMGEHSVPGVTKRGLGLADYLGRCQVRKQVTTREAAATPAQDGLSFAELRRKQADTSIEDEPGELQEARSTPQEPLTVEQLCQSTAVENLHFLSAGTTGGNAPELLGKEGCVAQLLAEAIKDFDRIVIDSAPLLGVSDSLLLLEHVDATCLVVRAATTPITALERVLEMLNQADAQRVGFVLNDVLSRDLEAYG